MGTITLLVLLFVLGYITGERETIRHFQINEYWKRKPLLYRFRFSLPELWAWYSGNKWKYNNPIVQFIMRYPLAMLKDGWHFLKTVELLIVCYIIAVLTPMQIEFMFIPPVVSEMVLYYVIVGVAFNISYHT